MKNLSKSQRVWGSVLIVFAAVMTLLAILFGVNWATTKKTLSNFKSKITLNFDMNDDKKIDYSYTFEGIYGGKSLEEILKHNMPKESNLKFSFSGDMLKKINTVSQDDTHYWSIYSSTSANVNKYYDSYTGAGWGFDTPYDWKEGIDYTKQTPKEFHTTVGLPGLAMGPINEFTLSFIQWKK